MFFQEYVDFILKCKEFILLCSGWLSSELVTSFRSKKSAHVSQRVLLLHIVPTFFTDDMSSLDSEKRIDSVIYQISYYELENYCSSLEKQ